jgi:hypothetical protein
LSLPEALERSRRPDRLRESAELVASSLPENSVVLSGELAAHLRWFTQAPCVSLPDLVHRAYGVRNSAEAWDPLVPVREEIERHERDDRSVFVTTEGLALLTSKWGLRQDQIAPQGSEIRVLRKEPFLALVRIHSEHMERRAAIGP